MPGERLTPESPEAPAQLPTLDWTEIREPGCYLHIRTGLLMRVFPEEVGRGHLPIAPGGAMLMVRLSPDVGTSVVILRSIARRHGYATSF
jgi:hypothetical protein